MKTNEEFKAAVFAKREAYRKKRRKMLLEIAGGCCAFLIIFGGITALLRNAGTKSARDDGEKGIPGDALQMEQEWENGGVQTKKERCVALYEMLRLRLTEEGAGGETAVCSAVLQNKDTGEQLSCTDPEKICSALFLGRTYCAANEKEGVCTLTVRLADGTEESFPLTEWDALRLALS